MQTQTQINKAGCTEEGSLLLLFIEEALGEVLEENVDEKWASPSVSEMRDRCRIT